MNERAHMIPAQKKSWFEIKNISEASADVTLYGEIGGWGVQASDFIAQINALRVASLNVRINSQGGSVFDGFAIYNALNAHAAKKVVIVDGLAASIASVIAMAGDEIRMCENALMMIHRATCCAIGNADDLRITAGLLEKLEANIAKTYAARTGMTEAEASALMAADTWLNAAECKAKGLCTTIEPAKTSAKDAIASLDLSGLRNVPAALAAVVPVDTGSTGMPEATTQDPAATNAAAPVVNVAISPAPVAPAVDAEAAAKISDLTAKLSESEEKNADLAKKLADAEALSAANLGTPPVASIPTPTGTDNAVPSAQSVLETYRSLTGDKRQKFFEANKAAIWRAYDSEAASGK